MNKVGFVSYIIFQSETAFPPLLVFSPTIVRQQFYQ